MRVLVHPANEQDQMAAKWLLKRLPFQTRLALFLFDSGYNSPALLHWCQQGSACALMTTQYGVGFEVKPCVDR
jgi:hypothetical protein